MTTKADIKKLLSKRLTGKEAARLILQDSWEVDHQREGFLSDRDIQLIKAGLKTTQDIAEYNRLIDAYKLIDFTLKEAHIKALEAQEILYHSSEFIREYLLESMLRDIQLFTLPAIVTQKQYEELKAKQRELRLREIIDLRNVIEFKAKEILPGAIYKEYMSGEEDEDGDASFYGWIYLFLDGKYPDLLIQVISSIQEDIRAGKIRPIQISEKDYARIKDKKLSYEVRKKLKQDLFDIGISQQSQESLELLASSLDLLKNTSLDEAKVDSILESILCCGEDLYQAGYAAFIEDLDTYKPGLIEGTEARPAGMMQPLRVAIIQNPTQADIDNRGYYKDTDPLRSLSRYDERSSKHADYLQKAHKKICEYIKMFLSVQVILGVISKVVVGIDITEDLESWYKDIQMHIDLYNIMLESSKDRNLANLGMPDLGMVKIGRLKPTAKSLQYYKDRMAIALGEDWWGEALRTLDLIADDKDSLAQQLLSDLKLARNMAGMDTTEEATDDQEE